MELGISEGNAAELDNFRHRVDEIFSKVDKLEQKVDEVEQFYLSTCKQPQKDFKGCQVITEKDKDTHIPSLKKQRQEAVHREAAAAKRMRELMRHFGTILRQWAWTNMWKKEKHSKRDR